MDEPLATDPHILASDLAKALRGDVEGALCSAWPQPRRAARLRTRSCLDRARRTASGPPGGLRARRRRRCATTAITAGLRTDAELISDLHHMKGTPEEVLASPELMAEVLPVLRADFLMCGAFVYRSRPPLPCPIRALGGSDDTPLDALRAWADETSADFGPRRLSGQPLLHSRAPGRGARRDRARSRDANARRLCGPALEAIVASDWREGAWSVMSVSVRPLIPGRPLPTLFEAAGPKRPPLGAALPAMREDVEQCLRSCGGCVFRGFALDGVDAFRAFAADFGHPLLSYEFGSTPRSRVASGVYTSTEYPAHQHIPLHNEQSYTPRMADEDLVLLRPGGAGGRRDAGRRQPRDLCGDAGRHQGRLRRERPDVCAQLRQRPRRTVEPGVRNERPRRGRGLLRPARHHLRVEGGRRASHAPEVPGRCHSPDDG